MTDDLKDRFRRLDSIEFPHGAGPPVSGPTRVSVSPPRVPRVATAAFALLVGAVAVIVAIRAFGGDATVPPLDGGTSRSGVSSDPTVEVPDLVGLGEQRALLELDDLGLTWLVSYREVRGVHMWRVVSTDPPAGTNVDSGSTVRVLVATLVTTLPEGAAEALDCDPAHREAFGGPNLRVLPGGSLYITGNLAGIERDDEVVQVTFGDREWDGLWHVIRAGSVIAVVDWGSLDGVACQGSGVAGA